MIRFRGFESRTRFYFYQMRRIFVLLKIPVPDLSLDNCFFTALFPAFRGWRDLSPLYHCLEIRPLCSCLFCLILHWRTLILFSIFKNKNEKKMYITITLGTRKIKFWCFFRDFSNQSAYCFLETLN